MRLSESNTTTAKKGKKESVPSFLLEAHWFRDPKVRRLRRELGHGAGFVWLAIVGELRANDLALPLDFLTDLAHELDYPEEEFFKITERCKTLGLLAEDRGFILCPALNRRIEAYRGVSEEKRKAGIASGEARRSKQAEQSVPLPLPTSSPSCSTGCSTESVKVLNTPNIIQSNTIESNRTESRKGEPEGETKTPPDPPPNGIADLLGAQADKKFLDEAESNLLKPEKQAWTSENAFMLMGKRPMERYPNVRLTATELALIIELYTNSNLPRKAWRRCFLRADGDVKKKLQAGTAIESVNVSAWLMGYILTDTLSQVTKEIHLAKASEVRT